MTLSYRDTGAFILVTVVWGTSFVAIRVGVDHFPPSVFMAAAYLIAGSLLLAYSVTYKDQWYPSTLESLRTTVFSGVFMYGIYSTFIAFGQQRVPGAVAAVIVGLIPMFTTMFSSIWSIRRSSKYFSPVSVAGLVLGFIGLGFVIRPSGTSLVNSDLVGKAFITFAAASFAVGSVLTDNDRAGTSPWVIAPWSMLFGVCFILVIGIITAGRGMFTYTFAGSTMAVLALLYFGVSSTSYLLYYDMLQRYHPIELNLLLYVTPIVTATTEMIIFEESINTATILGFIMIVGAFALVKYEDLREYVRTDNRPPRSS